MPEAPSEYGFSKVNMQLERKWQMWIYAYIAGMPSTPHAMTMPMDMPMPAGH